MFIKMLYYTGNEVLEVIDVNNTSTSKECSVCH